ncbi:MAG: aldo/keto reductase family protein [Planctomycetota bacterium]
MEYRAVGRWGLRVSTIGFGSWLTVGDAVDEEGTAQLVRVALEHGVNLFDTADVYARGRAEEVLGKVLAGAPRRDLVLATKCYFPVGEGPNDRGLSRKHIDESCHLSLRRLRTEYIDLYQCHRYDDGTPLEETVRALDDLVRQGKVLYWGVSMWSARQIDDAMALCARSGATPPISNQPRYNLLAREIEAEVLPACERHGLGVLPYSPLAQGVLTGKYTAQSRPEGSRGTDPRRGQFMQEFLAAERLERVAQMKRLAEEAGMTPAQLALAWCLSRSAVSSVLVGTTRVAQLEENLDAAGRKLPDDLLRRLDDLFPG